MGVYRVHQEGVWSSTSPVSQRLEIIKMLDHVNGYLAFKYKKQVRAAKAEWYRQMAGICYGQGDRADAWIYLAKCFWHSCFYERRNLLNHWLKLWR